MICEADHSEWGSAGMGELLRIGRDFVARGAGMLASCEAGA